MLFWNLTQPTVQELVIPETITLEYTGQGETIDRFIKELEEKFGIVELARTGVTSLQRGAGSFTEDI